MIAQTESYKDGHREIYHRAGTIDGRKDEKFVWTHPETEKDLAFMPNAKITTIKADCVACNGGRIPREVAKAR